MNTIYKFDEDYQINQSYTFHKADIREFALNVIDAFLNVNENSPNFYNNMYSLMRNKKNDIVDAIVSQKEDYAECSIHTAAGDVVDNKMLTLDFYITFGYDSGSNLIESTEQIAQDYSYYNTQAAIPNSDVTEVKSIKVTFDYLGNITIVEIYNGYPVFNIGYKFSFWRPTLYYVSATNAGLFYESAPNCAGNIEAIRDWINASIYSKSEIDYFFNKMQQGLSGYDLTFTGFQPEQYIRVVGQTSGTTYNIYMNEITGRYHGLFFFLLDEDIDVIDVDSGTTLINNYTLNNRIDTIVYSPVTIPPFGVASDAELINVINGYYDGTYSLEQIRNVWSIGDVREISLHAIADSDIGYWSVGESHRTQNVLIRIIGFDHDELDPNSSTHIGNKTKALLTVDFKDCLRDATITDYQGSDNRENGYINYDLTNETGWSDCNRRLWCINGVKIALPSYISNLTKGVWKRTSVGKTEPSIEDTSDTIFLLSEVEIIGSTYGSYSGEGYQYEYYATYPMGKLKKPYWSSGKQSDRYWTRSPYKGNTYNFVYIDENGNPSTNGGAADMSLGISVAFCL